MYMTLCPNCGNPCGDTEKYCTCCGTATGTAAMQTAASNPAEAAADSYDNDTLINRDLLPGQMEAHESNMLADNAPMQPIWVTQSSNQPLDGSIDESFLEEPISDDSDSLQNSPLNNMKSNSSYYDPVETDIFDDVADSASSLYSNMSPKVKKIMLSLIVGTLLSLIPIIYAACSHNTNPFAGTYVQPSTSTAGAIISPAGSTASGAK